MKKSIFILLLLTGLYGKPMAQWEQINSPLYAPLDAFAVSGDYLYAGLHVGMVYRSADKGNSWQVTNMPISFSMCIQDTTIYTAIDNLVHVSKDKGDSYTTLNTGLTPDCNAYSVEVLGDIILVESENEGCVISTDNGGSWTITDQMYGVNSLTTIGDSIFAGTGTGVKISADGGTSWSTSGLEDSWITSLLTCDGRILVSTYSDGIFFSDDKGGTWLPSSTDMSSSSIGSLLVNGTDIYAAAGHEGVWKSGDKGESWEPVGSGFPEGIRVSLLAALNNTVFAGTSSFGVFSYNMAEDKWIHSSKDLGEPASIISMAALGNRIIAGTSLCGLHTSGNSGADWNISDLSQGIYSLFVYRDSVYAGTTNGVYLSADTGSTWTHIGLPGAWVTAVIVAENSIYAGTENGVLKTTNKGLNWSEINIGIPDHTHIYCLAIQENKLFAGSFESGIYRSSDEGENWTPVSSGLPYDFVRSMYVDGSSLYASVWWNGVYRSDDVGESWSPAGLDNTCVRSFALSGDSLLAATWNNGVFSTHDQGATWNDISTGLTDPVIESMLLTADKLYIGQYQGGGIWEHTLSAAPPLNILFDKTEFNIFPSPARNSISIRSSDQLEEAYVLRIYTSDGVLLDSKLIRENCFSLDVSGLVTGVYLFRIQSGTEVSTHKIIIQ